MFLTKGSGPAKAICSLVLDGVFAVHGVRVVAGRNGLFVQMPQEKGRDGRWHDVCHPVISELRQAIQDVVLRTYTEMAASKEVNGGTADG